MNLKILYPSKIYPIVFCMSLFLNHECKLIYICCYNFIQHNCLGYELCRVFESLTSIGLLITIDAYTSIKSCKCYPHLYFLLFHIKSQ